MMFKVGTQVQIGFDSEVYVQGVNITEDEIGVITMVDGDMVSVEWSEGLEGWVNTRDLEVYGWTQHDFSN